MDDLESKGPVCDWLTEMLFFNSAGGSWVWNVTGRARSLLIQREVSNLNTLLLIYLIL